MNLFVKQEIRSCFTILLQERLPGCRVQVAHTCNPSYSGGRDQEDCSLKPAGANSSQDPISKTPNTKRAGVVVQAEGSEFKPQYHKKKRKEKRRKG
jgi:hypothetical protein